MADLQKIREAQAHYDQVMAYIGGCSNGTCLINPPKGMHTNGPCHCLHRDKYIGPRVALQARILRKKIMDALSTD